MVNFQDKNRLVVGLQPVREVIRVHKERVFEVLIENGGSPRLEAVQRFASDQGAPLIRRVPRAELDRLSQGAVHQGVAAWAPLLAFTELLDLIVGCDLMLALDSIQDPQNFGAAIRSAVGVAAAAVLWAEHDSAPLSLATFRASAGAIEHARLCRVRSLRSALSEAAAAGISVVGLDSNGTKSIRECDLRGPTILVLGSEHEGLSRGVRKECTSLAKLPMAQGVASLNASVAAAIALYEVASQRVISNT